jgi:hypothetical protein
VTCYSYRFGAQLMHLFMVQVEAQVGAWLIHLFMVHVDYRLRYRLMHGGCMVQVIGIGCLVQVDWYRLFGAG